MVSWSRGVADLTKNDRAYLRPAIGFSESQPGLSGEVLIPSTCEEPTEANCVGTCAKLESVALPSQLSAYVGAENVGALALGTEAERQQRFFARE